MIYVVDNSKVSRDNVCLLLEFHLRVQVEVKDCSALEALKWLQVDQPRVVLVRESVLGSNAELLAMVRALAVPTIVIHDVQPGEFEVDNVPRAVVHVERPVQASKIWRAMEDLLDEETLEEILPVRQPAVAVA